tara:strand:- start:1120 stop:1509 length:390 start_codon:yes stop_codon:yes gene_type:complete
MYYYIFGYKGCFHYNKAFKILKEFDVTEITVNDWVPEKLTHAIITQTRWSSDQLKMALKTNKMTTGNVTSPQVFVKKDGDFFLVGGHAKIEELLADAEKYVRWKSKFNELVDQYKIEKTRANFKRYSHN